MNPHAFRLIQNFFSNMRCHLCDEHLEPDGIELIRQEDPFYVVHITCHHCQKSLGMAMVGLEDEGLEDERLEGDDGDTLDDALDSNFKRGVHRRRKLSRLEHEILARLGLVEAIDPTEGGRFPDPELTPSELERFEAYQAITEDDVLDAHRFFQNLDANWQQQIPPVLKTAEALS